MSAVERENERARARAAESGQPTYRHDVVENWPACTVCGHVIRDGRPFLPTGCGCPEVWWRQDSATCEWTRIEPDREDCPGPTTIGGSDEPS